MWGGCATAATNQVQAILCNKALNPCGHFCGCKRVMGLAVHQFWQARIGLHGNEPRPVFRQPFHVFGHFLWAGCAVQAHQIHIKAMNDCGCRSNVRPYQQGACGFYRDLHKNRGCGAQFFPCNLYAVYSCLDLKCVLAGFNQDCVYAAFNQATGLLCQSSFKAIVINIAQRGQLGAGAHGAQNIAGAAIGKAFCSFARQYCGVLVDFPRFVCQTKFTQCDGGATKRIGFHHVCTGFKITAVDFTDKFRA